METDVGDCDKGGLYGSRGSGIMGWAGDVLGYQTGAGLRTGRAEAELTVSDHGVGLTEDGGAS